MGVHKKVLLLFPPVQTECMIRVTTLKERDEQAHVASKSMEVGTSPYFSKCQISQNPLSMLSEETQEGSSVDCFSGMEMLCLYTTPAESCFTGNPETQPALGKKQEERKEVS